MNIIFPILFVLFVGVMIWKVVKKDYTAPGVPSNPPTPSNPEPTEPDPPVNPPVDPPVDPHIPDHPC